MTTIELGDVVIALTFKEVKNTHLSVHPPDGRVTLVTPIGTRPEVARAFAISKLHWIRGQQAALRAQRRESPSRFVERETHHVWGRRHLLAIRESEGRPRVALDHRRITLTIRPGSSQEARATAIHSWHKAVMHRAVQPLIARWEAKLGVQVTRYFLQRMKTKWGSCNAVAGHIRLNTELVKKPKDLLEYVIVHEMLHLIEPKHSGRFMDLLDAAYPGWREARQELNELPLPARW